jgi:hypothetical protein
MTRVIWEVSVAAVAWMLFARSEGRENSSDEVIRRKGKFRAFCVWKEAALVRRLTKRASERFPICSSGTTREICFSQ